ncbi:arylamine N-acetyltransferase [Leptobacterium flavescens]|uniref:Arylamine N-acetyltransferase n=1 Tax=Leptobacterium flavescens TaxID=472055 RepID=A0A6P0UKE4_9FLAO|nr:arylamine N-acetyltransferase [Leptobacterium flavescens]NER13437.1 arylamine N-acetyltransferase [Leptobacterium flavescens]
MNIAEYLRRLRFSDDSRADKDTFIRLHRQHILNIPFENLDIQNKREIVLEKEALFKKVVDRNRGGFCYELNYLFHWLLNEIGFEVRIISASIFDDQGILGPPFDHMALIVTIEGKSWLADVGYGDLFIEPIQLLPGLKQTDKAGVFRIDRSDNGKYLLSGTAKNGKLEKKYVFDLQERHIADFMEECELKQHTPDSHFVKNKICTLATSDGRKTILNSKYIRRSNGNKTETPLLTEEQEKDILKNEFGIPD